MCELGALATGLHADSSLKVGRSKSAADIMDAAVGTVGAGAASSKNWGRISSPPVMRVDLFAIVIDQLYMYGLVWFGIGLTWDPPTRPQRRSLASRRAP